MLKKIILLKKGYVLKTSFKYFFSSQIFQYNNILNQINNVIVSISK